MTDHLSLPLRTSGQWGTEIRDTSGWQLASVTGTIQAKEIVAACNAHAELLEVCKLAQYAIEACWLHGMTSSADLCQSLRGVDKERFEEARERLRAIATLERKNDA